MSQTPLGFYELPQALVAPALEACRLFNTALDVLFYDVPGLVAELTDRGERVATQAADDAPDGRGVLDLSALRDPEGSLLVVDPERRPYVRRFAHVDEFLHCQAAEVRGVEVASITGVGSSALGSAALAWNIAKALGAPVLAIVPGYGVADAVLQGLGGWFGFGLQDALSAKTQVQTAVGALAPDLARLGRQLSDSSPGRERLPNGAPVFRYGCGSSDVLHDLMERRRITCVVGHSKGALSIHNALESLPADRTSNLRVVTLGCPVPEDIAGAKFHQFLGLYDALGRLNAWGRRPEHWVPADHSTNVSLPLSMRAQALVAR
jgi:hypothetical protein